MKKISLLACSLAIAGLGFTSCSDDDNNNDDVRIEGTYDLVEVNTEDETDLNNDGDAHLNQMDESDCYNEGRITLNDDNTFTYIYTAVLIDEAEGSIGCAEEITYTGTWELVSGSTSEAVIEITYEAGNGEDTSLLLAKTDNELVWTDDTLVSQYPDRDDEGAPVYTLGSTQFVYRK
ncbi:MAG TPA: hypothetical protein VEA37_07285 [Flavobacterium sp.]|nr:hypothetical protein [Flavobacterium sp.]